MTTGKDWTDYEVALIVADYFTMLEKELDGIAYSKAEHRRNLKPLLNNRSDGSVEFKHQNISAVLMELKLIPIRGYKAKYNYQDKLAETVIAHVEKQKSILEPKFLQFTESLAVSAQNNYTLIEDTPPEQQDQVTSEPSIPYERRPIKINYLEREQRNLLLGHNGEQLVVKYEQQRLIRSGKASLADKIEWVAEYNDGAGFDILSKNDNGSDRYIEVKTTKLTKETPFYFTKKEYEFSINKKEDYHLYRVFNYSEASRLFIVNGSFDQFCRKEAVQYKGYF